jgi:hypothetical protein
MTLDLAEQPPAAGERQRSASKETSPYGSPKGKP